VFFVLISASGQQVIAYDSEGQVTILGNDRLFKNGFD
jgi:hypothetical protein